MSAELGPFACRVLTDSAPVMEVALAARAEHPSALVREHVAWALARHGA